MNIKDALEVLAGGNIGIVKYSDGWVLRGENGMGEVVEVGIDERVVRQMAEEIMWSYAPA